MHAKPVYARACLHYSEIRVLPALCSHFSHLPVFPRGPPLYITPDSRGSTPPKYPACL